MLLKSGSSSCMRCGKRSGFRVMKKVLFYGLLIFVLIPLAFLNLGKWIDVTEEPVKADIVICLGGGTVERVKKSITLIEQGYVQKDVFLLLGESWYNQPYIRENYPELEVKIEEKPTNTKEEVLFIKKFMVENGYKTALVVTDPPHTRRVSLLNAMLSVEGDEEITFHMIDSDVKWWEKEKYYDHLRSAKAVLNESMKILYSVVVYGIFSFEL